MELWSLIRALRQAADPEAHTLGENTHWFVHFAYGSSLSLFLSAPVVRAETCCDKDTHKCRWSMQQKSLMFPVQSGLLSATLVRPSAHINIACWYLYECLCSIPAHICRVVDAEGFLKSFILPFFLPSPHLPLSFLTSLPSSVSLPPPSSSHSQVVFPPAVYSSPPPLPSLCCFIPPSSSLSLRPPAPLPLLCVVYFKEKWSQINLNPKKVIDGCAKLSLSISFLFSLSLFPHSLPTSLSSLPLALWLSLTHIHTTHTEANTLGLYSLINYLGIQHYSSTHVSHFYILDCLLQDASDNKEKTCLVG